MVHVLEDRHGRQELLILFSLFLGGVFHNVVEGLAVEDPEEGLGLRLNGGGSWRIVKQCKLPKDITNLVLFQERGRAADHF